MQRSRVYHEQELTGFVRERDVKVDEENGGKQCHGESAVMAGEPGERRRNVGSPGGRQGSMEVLG